MPRAIVDIRCTYPPGSMWRTKRVYDLSSQIVWTLVIAISTGFGFVLSEIVLTFARHHGVR
jgi:hypothetical protein